MDKYWKQLNESREQESKDFVILSVIHKVLTAHGSGNRSIITSGQKLKAIRILLGGEVLPSRDRPVLVIEDGLETSP